MTNITTTADQFTVISRREPVDQRAFLAGFRGGECPAGGRLEDYGHGVTAARTFLLRAKVEFTTEAPEEAVPTTSEQ